MWSSKVFHARNFPPTHNSAGVSNCNFFACCLMKRIVETFTVIDDCYEINPIKSNKSKRFLFSSLNLSEINKQDCAGNFFLMAWIYLLHIDQTFVACHVIRKVVLRTKKFNNVYEHIFMVIAISILRLSSICQRWWWYVMQPT